MASDEEEAMRSMTGIVERFRFAGSYIVGIAVLALMCAANSGADATDFVLEAPFLSFDVGCGPSSVALVDLNGDGSLDLAVGNSNPYAFSVSVLLGRGDGTYGPTTNFNTYYGCESVAIGDLNGDGRPDLAAAGYDFGRGVSVLLGNGDGTFASGANHALAGITDFVAIADLNMDGKADLAASSGGAVLIMLGNGDGTFGPASASGTGAGHLAIGDLDGDGTPDLVVARGDSVLVTMGVGDGTFVPSSGYPGGARNVAIADLNADGRPDLATDAVVFLGNGDGTFGPAIDHELSGDDVVVGDLNRDGKPDLATDRSVLPGNGDGTFGAAIQYWDDAMPYWAEANSVAVGDVNGDGKPDLVEGHAESSVSGSSNCALGTALVYLGNGDGTFGVKPRDFEVGAPGALPRPPRSVAIADLDGDHRLDVAVTNPGSNNVSVLLGDGNGALGPKTDYAVGTGPSCLAIGDLNGDQRLDLAVANYSSNTVSVLLGNGNGTFVPKADFVTAAGPRTVAIGDVDRDGRPDLVVGRSLLPGNGDGTFGPATNYFPAGPLAVAIADFNGDARPDLAIAPASAIIVLLGNGDRTFAPSFEIPLHPYVIPENLAVEDLNRDGKPDLIIGYAADQLHNLLPRVSPMLGNGDGEFTGSGASGTRGGFPVIADLDGDGRPDVLAAGSRLSVLLGNGDGTLAPRLDYGSHECSAAAVGDLNGDGGPDVVTANAGSSTISVQLNIGPGRPTPVLLSLFSADWNGRGVELRWRFGVRGGFAGVVVERAGTAAGPWKAAEGERREDGDASIFLDPGAEAGHTYYYRLVATRADGGTTTFGPLEVTAGAGALDFGLIAVAPNPAADRVRIEFVVARAARVRLSVLDVQGRRVALLAEGLHPAGRYQAAWDGAGENGRAAAGLYFARYEAAGHHWVRRFTLLR